VHEERLTSEDSPATHGAWEGAAYAAVSRYEGRRKRVLLTGATGFLGGAFLAHARAHDDLEWVLPARGASDADARERVARRLSRFLGEAEVARVLARAQVVCADLMTRDGLARLPLEGVTHVVHLAANTSFIAKKGVWEMNYEGTRALAERLRDAPALERFVYVGTAMICGGRPSETVVEDSYPDADAEHLVPYTASKAAAEAMLRQDFPELPLVVVRPSIVIGHSTLGCAPSGSIFWVVRALERVRLLSGAACAGLDVVPADYVALALDHLTFSRSLRHRTYHISAGRESATSIRETAARIAAARVEPLEDFTIIASADVKKHKHRIVEAFGATNGRRVQMALGLYLRFCELNVCFDNARLRAEGLPPAPKLLDYLDVCLAASAHLSIAEQADDEI